VNSGIYVFDVKALLGALPKISNRNKNGEYYLTDAISILSAAGKKVSIFKALNPEDVIQVNTRYDLSRAVNVLRERKIRDLSENGVTVLNPSSTWIDLEADIGRDTVVYPSVVIEGKTRIGERCCLYPGAHIINSRIGNHVSVFSSTVMVDATVEDEVIVGPFARLRPKTILRAGAHVGNFVEMKNTDFGRGSKAGHLSYLGDSEIGEGVNIGAGTITCNYDGVKKNRTVIEAGAFIGSGTQLVAPVKVGKGAYIAAGSVITKDVSPEALAVARGRQVERPGWARRKREKQRKEKENRKP
jgi:bifunctional UDP-N-acetylglucosamine pyrophosphorylase/glucosamine-1-phosphate N-acetyltransferase